MALDNTLGAMFIGLVVAATLHGISVVQAWYYYTHQNDAWPTKLLVGAVMTFETTHQILISHTVYTYSISSWGNVAGLETIVWSLVAEVIFNGLIGFLVQSFLAIRVWRLSNRSILLTGAVGLLVLSEFVTIITFSALVFPMKTYAQLATLEGLSISVNALAAAGDVLIAGILCSLLHRSRTGFHKSDTMITKLMLFSVNTGLLTGLCAVASLISIAVWRNSFIYIGFFFCIGRLYTNSLLATLNARKKIRNAGAIHTTSDISLTTRDFPKSGNRGSRRPANNISIKIDTTKDFATDQKLDFSETGSSLARGFEEKEMQSP